VGLKPVLRTTTSFSALTLLVGSFDPKKTVPEMTYNVFSGTLNPAESTLSAHASPQPKRHLNPFSETRRNLQGCPKLANRSQPLVGRSSPYYEDMWRRYRCLTTFFRLSIFASAAKIQPDNTARQICAMVPKWRFFASCIFSEPRAAHFRHAF